MTINPAAPAANQARQTPHSVVIAVSYTHLDVYKRQGLARVETGEFGADMKVTLTNDGPVTDVYKRQLPSRDDDGYGLSETAVALMAAKGVSLIVTVDNGVSAMEEIYLCTVFLGTFLQPFVYRRKRMVAVNRRLTLTEQV